MDALQVSPFGTHGNLEMLTTPTGVRQLKRGETLFRPGDPVENAFLLQRGRIRLLASHGSHDTGVPEGVVEAGAFVDVAALFSASSRYFRGGQALTDCRLLAFDLPLLLGLGQQHPGMLLEMLAQLSREVAAHSARARLLLKCGSCRFILFLLERLPAVSDRSGHHLILQESRKEIAASIAVKQETVSRIIATLIQDGHLQVRVKGSRVITIPRAASLETLMATCPRCVDAQGEARLSPGLLISEATESQVAARNLVRRVAKPRPAVLVRGTSPRETMVSCR